MRAFQLLTITVLGAFTAYTLASIDSWLAAGVAGVVFPAMGIGQIVKSSNSSASFADASAVIVVTAQASMIAILMLQPLGPIVESIQRGFSP